MKLRTSLFAALATLALAALAVPAASSADPVNSYTVTHLGSLGGGNTYAYGLNDVGQVAGVTSSAAGYRRAFLWQAGVMTDLGGLGGPNAAALAINEPGQVVGWAETAAFARHAFLWDPVNGMRDLGTLGGAESDAYAVNDAGQVVGSSRLVGGALRACLWQDGRAYDLGTLVGYPSSIAYGINARGEIVGLAEDAVGNQRAFRWSPSVANGATGTMVALQPQSSAAALALNDTGEMVGRNSSNNPFLWDAAGGRTLPLLPPGWNGYYTYPVAGAALAINDSRTVVGENTVYIDYGEFGYDIGYQAFVWDSAAGSRRLAELIDGFGDFTSARGINTDGRIAANGPGWACLLTPSPIPLGPRYLSAQAGDAQVRLTWAIAAGATAYHVKRSTDPAGPYVTIAQAPGPEHTDGTALNGTLYYYVVSAVNAWGESSNSYPASAQPVARPAAPANLTAVGGDQMVHLSWDPSVGADFYLLGRATGSGGPYYWFGYTYEPLYDDYGYTEGSDPPLENGVTYYYVVYAVNGGGDSPLSNEASATTVAPPPPPAPTGLTATPGNRQVLLSWDSTPGASMYWVKRSTSAGGPYTYSNNVYSTGYWDNQVENGVTYHYVVSAVNSGGEGPNSNQVSATPIGPAPPAAPTALTATAGRHKVTLKWRQSTTPGITENRVYRASVGGGPYFLVAVLGATRSYTDTGLDSRASYFYVVTASRSGSESGYSAEVRVRVK